ncbi:hypothetical protein [Burkholderia sp. BCC0397]|uniref:hypothetical protein n=1 Tax=Burkholderia sp. BCC0397 TaxID=486876 RepID=UPI00158A1C32|nr:hypothetical protein [Burkholderia sp. BCC0397]
MALLLSFSFAGSPASLASEYNSGKTNPDNPDQINIKKTILINIKEIVDHGDLSDELFYESKLGISMAGGETRHVNGYDDLQYLRSQPYPGSAKSHDWDVQQYYYTTIPDYFDEKFGINGNYVRPYAKVFLPSGKIGAVASIIFNTEKLCITEDDVKNEFKNNSLYSETRGMFRVKYSGDPGRDIDVEMTSTYMLPKRCVKYVNFSQNFTGIK